MSWASRKRLVIISVVILGAIIVAAGAAFAFFSVTREAPSCMDGAQNGDETGVDCGGSCTYLCSDDTVPPSVSFVRPVSAGVRTDVIAYVSNPNPSAAARNAHFDLELFGTDRMVLGKSSGSVDLPPGVTVPVYLPNVYAGSAPVGQAFLTFDDATLRWFRAPNVLSPIRAEAVQVSGTSAPRVTATITNSSASQLRDVSLVAVVFDASGLPIAASRTLVRVVPGHGSASATFAWNDPFSASPARVEVRPIPALP